MKSIQTLISAVAMLLIAAGAYAQRGHGPIGGSSNTGGMGSGMGTGMDGTMGGMSLLVAADGTVITTSATFDSATNRFRSSAIAVSPNGNVAWRWAAPNGIHRIELADRLVLVSTGEMGYDASTTPVTPELTALTLSNGAVAWKVTLPGIAMAIEPSSNGVYALVVQPQGTGPNGSGNGMGGGQHGPRGGGSATGMMNGARTLVAISNSGVILWTLALN